MEIDLSKYPAGTKFLTRGGRTVTLLGENVDSDAKNYPFLIKDPQTSQKWTATTNGRPYAQMDNNPWNIAGPKDDAPTFPLILHTLPHSITKVTLDGVEYERVSNWKKVLTS